MGQIFLRGSVSDVGEGPIHSQFIRGLSTTLKWAGGLATAGTTGPSPAVTRPLGSSARRSRRGHNKPEQIKQVPSLAPLRSRAAFQELFRAGEPGARP